MRRRDRPAKDHPRAFIEQSSIHSLSLTKASQSCTWRDNRRRRYAAMDGGGNDGAEGSVPGKRPDCQTAAEYVLCPPLRTTFFTIRKASAADLGPPFRFIDDQLRLEADAREALPYVNNAGCHLPLAHLS